MIARPEVTGRKVADDALREVVASLWTLVVTTEDGDTDVDKALRAAKGALKQALERGASDEETRKLTQDLRQALDNFMRQLAEQLRDNPQALTRPPTAGEKAGNNDVHDAYSIAEFCRRHSISVPLFYKLKQQGKAPATFYAGVRQLVSREAAAAWRRKQEQAAAREVAATS
jgi:ABC-type transporter Mla subunit MlaD